MTTLLLDGTYVTPKAPAGILADAIDPVTGELLSLTRSYDPTDGALVTALRTVRGSGSAVREVGQRYQDIEFINDQTSLLLRQESARTLGLLTDSNQVSVLSVKDLELGPDGRNVEIRYKNLARDRDVRLRIAGGSSKIDGGAVWTPGSIPILIDYHSPSILVTAAGGDGSAISILGGIKAVHSWSQATSPNQPILRTTGSQNGDDAVDFTTRAMELGISRALRKPFHLLARVKINSGEVAGNPILAIASTSYTYTLDVAGIQSSGGSIAWKNNGTLPINTWGTLEFVIADGGVFCWWDGIPYGSGFVPNGEFAGESDTIKLGLSGFSCLFRCSATAFASGGIISGSDLSLLRSWMAAR
jgi:hypothetical protein